MLELLLPFVIYLAAKSLHIGAVIAVVAVGFATHVGVGTCRPSAGRTSRCSAPWGRL